MKPGIVPVGDKVLVKPERVEERTKGGIIIAETTRDRSAMRQTRGTLVACGPVAGAELGEPWAKPGDSVMFARLAGIFVKGKDGESYRIINDMDITAVIEEGVTFDAEI